MMEIKKSEIAGEMFVLKFGRKNLHKAKRVKRIEVLEVLERNTDDSEICILYGCIIGGASMISIKANDLSIYLTNESYALHRPEVILKGKKELIKELKREDFIWSLLF